MIVRGLRVKRKNYVKDVILESNALTPWDDAVDRQHCLSHYGETAARLELLQMDIAAGSSDSTLR